MCGIVGYIGSKNALPILIAGLKRLEYRGYDSAGVSIFDGTNLQIKKQPGKIADLEKGLSTALFTGTVGIGHTRWATHGEPSEVNAHPHQDCTRELVIIHNGIIENYNTLKQNLLDQGHHFESATDTEVVAHLIEEFCKTGVPVETAIRLALSQIQGTYGLVVQVLSEPDRLYAARMGSPLIIGVGQSEYYIASDVAALVEHTKDVSYLTDGEMAIIQRDQLVTKTIQDKIVEKKIERIALDLEKIEKDGYPHFMLKEIMHQPATVADSMRGRVLEKQGIARLGGIGHDFESLLYARRLVISACGTSYYASLIGKYMLEKYVRIPVEVEYASEFRYRNPIIDQDTVVIVISQSGETADTLAASREAKKRGAKVYGICNVVGSSIARETDAGVYLHAGPEIGVASTKAFTSQVTVLALITLFLARKKSMSTECGRQIVEEMKNIPAKIAQILENNHKIETIAQEYYQSSNFLYLGRGFNYPVALEGALKLKEISYIHAEGYPAAEIKHGPIALITENMPVVVIAAKDPTYDKIMSNIEEVRARKGKILAIATEGDDRIQTRAEHVIHIPETIEFLMPILTIIPLQLLAYNIAVLRGCHVDQPRNLAKSVTVE
ncbi:glutamine--fructose-6-phosphate transaminase (isomerizing) [candidate division KSB1 bacterium]|nr:glutamine--fructose-6-phosphate transaminase (isomerizing) [candidate division KSB1 bacterium]